MRSLCRRAPPLCRRGRGGQRGRNPIERVSPSVRAFAYFSHEGKVGRGVGPKAPWSKGAAPGNKKNLSSPLGDERLTFRGTTRIRASGARSCPCNGGPPSRSHGPLPGEPRDTLQGGFQPVAASLSGMANSLFSRSSHVLNCYLYHRNNLLARGIFAKIFSLRTNLKKMYCGSFNCLKICQNLQDLLVKNVGF